ncbi:ferredoxin [Mycetocola zhujimingii]|uniref:Ferredoxin n=1 Tax=Mycetocola zhujimingii TaxID=2079792 RepID=A0A2U1TA67_9MICO|nr:ferredoxin [Mycetocola zhujimingii]AWB85528.1 ferredoxin [Mycetocola zhujimingii]PWC04574.1 ferredoxin [Mycetocola zhujimingii]
MKVIADIEVCVAAGVCVAIAPDVFDQDDEVGKVILLNATPGSDEHDAVRDAVLSCPSAALRLVDES